MTEGEGKDKSKRGGRRIFFVIPRNMLKMEEGEEVNTEG